MHYSAYYTAATKEIKTWKFENDFIVSSVVLQSLRPELCPQ